jgi:hypothetical protein
MLRNSRRTAARLRPALPGAREFTHRLYVALAPGRALTEQQAKNLAGAMCRHLGDIGLPLRHAGSFGFDFAAAEWFHDTARDRHLVRVAVPDLPTEQGHDRRRDHPLAERKRGRGVIAHARAA